MSIIVEQLTKIYGEQKAVNNISFTINKGEIVGFLGPNGAGKSTTMKMLTTYIQPTSGYASVSGFDIIKSPMEVKKHVGYLPESNPLYYDMYVREYLHFAGSVHNLPNIKSRVEEVIELTGLSKEVKKKIGTLSKGYKQRVGIAQAIIHDPHVLILDEPTSGLDPNQIDEIRALVLNIGKDKSVMLSTHIMQEVEAMCSRVIIINEGQLVKDEALTSNTSGDTQETIQVEFAQAISENLLNEALVSMNVSLHKYDGNLYIVKSDDMPSVKRAIMNLSIKENIDIVSMQAHTQSLEDIFKQATYKKSNL